MDELKSNDEQRINVTNPEEITFWSQQFDVSEVSIRAATQAVGTKIDDIREYLRKMDQKFE